MSPAQPGTVSLADAAPHPQRGQAAHALLGRPGAGIASRCRRITSADFFRSLSNFPVVTTKPYLIRAIHEWCTDQGFTPYLAVAVDANTRVPREYIKDGQIVLNVGAEATSNLRMGDEEITFQARFSGASFPVHVPIAAVAAIYARENGQGMAFEAEAGAAVAEPMETEKPALPDADSGQPPKATPGGSRSHLTRIK